MMKAIEYFLEKYNACIPTTFYFLGLKEYAKAVHESQIKNLYKLVLYAISYVPYSKKT